ncbi:hypothetical protein [Sporomusa termitida]|nr:hypothetical protein [Sporomusa termitida]
MNTVIPSFIQWLKQTLTATDKTTQTSLRILAAGFGGYALTTSVQAALALLLPWPKVDTLFFCALLPALIYPAALLWIFAAPSAQHAWRGVLTGTLFCGILALIAAWLR